MWAGAFGSRLSRASLQGPLSLEEMLSAYKRIIDQMIYYGGLGAFFDRDTRVHTADGKAYVVRPEFVNDFENEDYNNAYYEVEVVEEE